MTILLKFLIIFIVVAWAIIPKTIHWEFFNGLVIINSWRLFLLIFALPPLVAGISCCFCMESPKFLFAQGRKEEAMKILMTMYSINSGLPPDTYPVSIMYTFKVCTHTGTVQ